MFEVFNGETVRDAFGRTLIGLAKQDVRVVLVSGDSEGASKTIEFAEKFPDRSFNLGIAEQNMVGFAAGLAYEGFVPFVSTRAPFLSMRAAEQIRTAVCYDNLPVKFIGTGGGYCSGTAGATHWALEDVAIMSSFANMTICETGDPILVKKILEESLRWNKPLYIRLGKDRIDSLYKDVSDIRLGQAIEISSGEDGYFICSGTVVNFAVEAMKILQREYGMNVGVVDMFTIKPIDRAMVLHAAATGRIIVAEDHNIIGGLGDHVGRVLLEEGCSCSYKVLGCPDFFVPASSAEYLYHVFKFDTEGLVDVMRGLM